MFLSVPQSSYDRYDSIESHETDNYNRGVACLTLGEPDLIEAHKWFNLAALNGDPRGATARADVAIQMHGSDVFEAQRRARLYVSGRQ